MQITPSPEENLGLGKRVKGFETREVIKLRAERNKFWK
jgi:hypothetical protein